MKVGIIGSGGREHAISLKLNSVDKVKQIYCFPGNAGTAEIAENISLNLENFNELKEFIVLKKIGSWIRTTKKYFSDVQSNISQITDIDNNSKDKTKTKETLKEDNEK